MEVLKKGYLERYQEPLKVAYFSPGRVNLIGEHIDYNGGHVFPCAISLGIYGTIRPLEDDKIVLISLNVKDKPYETTISGICPTAVGKWYDYVLGVIVILEKHGFIFPHGFEMMIHGDLPNGSGLSSSAALEMLTMKMCVDLFDFKLDKVTEAVYCQEAENKYVGVNCGIMDQFAVSLGRENHAIYLDTETLKYYYAPLEIGRNQLIIINCGKRRSLTNSGYNKRRSECEKALAILKKKYPIKDLCDLSMDQLRNAQDLFTDYTLYRRARHCVSENERTEEAYQALILHDLVEFGKLMFKSHNSLRKDYQVSCFELNTLVDFARKHHAKGARMTGAGFGGCVVVLIKNSRVAAFIEDVQANYTNLTGCTPSIYQVNISEGTRKVEVPE